MPKSDFVLGKIVQTGSGWLSSSAALAQHQHSLCIYRPNFASFFRIVHVCVENLGHLKHLHFVLLE